MKNRQITKVLHYIESHLNEPIDMPALAKVAGYSPYHFCRIFKLHTGESVMAYVTRLRLERAARALYSKKSITEIGFDAGYESTTGFLKAFKKHFGTTPSAYKKAVENRLQRYTRKFSISPEVVKFETRSVVFVREHGEYMQSSRKAWDGLIAKMDALGSIILASPPKMQLDLDRCACDAIGICHDDPTVTNMENIRYDAVLAWGEKEIDALKQYGFETKTITGGIYAKACYSGIENGEDTWYALYGWIGMNGYTLRDAPPFEVYIGGATYSDKETLKVEVYIPIVR